ncbi:MAG: carbonic anhydrase [Saprospiraceae bacterium]|nr:carbonic anhydrase [Saprospiraceae bacterium]
MKAHTKETQETITPSKALQFLQEGNQRFLNNLKLNRNLLEQVNDTRDGQFPFASILSCSDSRTSTELVFDQGLGDIFSVRLAGNIASEFAIGSLEFACKYLGSKIIVVLGHTQCGAVKGACDGFKDGNITNLLEQIHPAVEREEVTTENRTSKNLNFVQNVMHHNVEYQISKIYEISPLLAQMKAEGKIDIVGAIYDVATGEVKFKIEE